PLHPPILPPFVPESIDRASHRQVDGRNAVAGAGVDRQRETKEPAMAKKTKRRAASTRARSGHTKARGGHAHGGRKWSKRVTERSNALDLDPGVFKLRSAKEIAASLKRSAERSRRRKANAYRSALSMLTFYINRAGRGLPASRKKTLNAAKGELK